MDRKNELGSILKKRRGKRLTNFDLFIDTFFILNPSSVSQEKT
jgi:hypothetical protein